MPRVKRGPKRKNRRAKILKLAKGYYGMKSRGHRIAKEQVERGLNFAFAGRKDRKGEFRKLWIARINAAARLNGICTAAHRRPQGRRQHARPQGPGRPRRPRRRRVHRAGHEREGALAKLHALARALSSAQHAK